MALRELVTLNVLLLGLAACGGNGEVSQEQAPADTAAVTPRQAPVSDNQALDVLSEISAAGSGAARAALTSATNPEVRRYLSVVLADHEALQRELAAIADSLQLPPEPSPVAQRLRSAAQDAAAQLMQPGTADEAGVLRQQVRLHTMFLGALDSTVLRTTRQQLVAQYATAMRPTVAAHLERAKQLERMFAEEPAAGTSASRATVSADTATRPRPANVRERPDTVPQY